MRKICIISTVLFLSLSLCVASVQTDNINLQNERAKTEKAQGDMLNNKTYYSVDSVNSPYAEWRRPGDLREAVMHYNNSLAIEYKASTLFSLGLAYMKLGQFSEAIDSYSKAITLAPDSSSRVYLYRAWCYTKLGMKEQASKDLKKAAAMTPEEKFNGYPILYQDMDVEKTYDHIAYPEKYGYFISPIFGFHRI